MLRRVWLVVSGLAGCGGEGARSEAPAVGVVAVTVPEAGPTYPGILEMPVREWAREPLPAVVLSYGAPVVQGPMDLGAALALVRAKEQETRYCWMRAAAPERGEHSVTVRVLLEPAGAVRATVVATDFRAGDVPECVRRRFERWPWAPRSAAASFEIAIRFVVGAGGVQP